MSRDTAETAALAVAHVATTAAVGEFASALAHAATALGLLHHTDAREPLQRLRDALVHHLDVGGHVQLVENAYIDARAAALHVIDPHM
ncbi:MAG: hypothetical protein L0H93_02530 [Nocardioides sp.]|nr:hypothetical protein [Nocardioides sp.]